MLCMRSRTLCSALVLFTVCEFCTAQGYYGYNPYYPYYRRPTKTQTAKRIPNTANRLQNNYLSNPYASVAPNNKRTQSATLNSLPDIYRRSQNNYATTTTTTTTRRPTTRYRVSKADAENAKFVGASNQEAADETSKTLQILHRRRRPYGNRCSLFGRQSGRSNTATASTAPKEQGRFLWDLNVYNIYGGGSPIGGGGIYSDPIQSADSYGGCGGGGGLGGGLLGGGGLLSDPYDDGGYAQPAAPPLNTFLSLFAPGILQNALAATARPQYAVQPQNDPTGSDLQSDPAVDPNYGQSTLPVRRPVPNRIYYDTPGASPVTPAQLIGGVATTVNGIIQQLTGNLQPVYPGYG